MSNRHGKFLPGNNSASVGIGLFSEADTVKKIGFHYGIEGFARQNVSSDIWLHQFYGGITLFDLIQVRLGKWEDIIGSNEPQLSSGSVIWSGNARPVPKIQIGSKGYVDVPYTNGYLEVKGLLAHGWFEEGRYVSNVLLHHKNVYLKLGGSFPLNIYYGFNHFALWGGISPDQDEPYPTDFNTYLKVFFNRSGDPDVPGTPQTWVNHRVGNSLGSRNYGIDLNLDDVSVGIYHQDVFEDGSGMRKMNFPDGLWGTRIRSNNRRKLLQGFVYEVLYTKNQSGPSHNDEDGNVVGGNDNYFNHDLYLSGWTNHQYTIGTPLITSPIINSPDSFYYGYLINNRILAHHIGLEGNVRENIKYRSLLTYSRNYGTFNDPFPVPYEQFSIMLEFISRLPWYGLDANLTIAGDSGRMYGDNYGIYLSLSKIIQ